MIAILIHFLGHLCIDSAVPPWVESADSWFLAKWYAAFAAIDLIACALADTRIIRSVLAISFAWSAALAVEQLMLLDYLQARDWLVQALLDGTLFLCLVVQLSRNRRSQKAF